MKEKKPKREVAIIHFNTPMLTEAAIKSLRKHGGEKYHVTIFDNSDTKPFMRRMRGVTVINNTNGQLIDFDAELSKFPERDRSIGCAVGCEFGSAKHMMTVQKLWELLPEGFVLMESYILIKRISRSFLTRRRAWWAIGRNSSRTTRFISGACCRCSAG